MAEGQEISRAGKKTTVNTWVTRTFLKRNCNAYLAQLDVSVLEKALEALVRVKEVKRMPEWRHYCGAEPRYWDVTINDDGSVVFEGGIVWRAKVENNILYTDGCTTRGLLIDVVDEAIKQASTLKCRWA